MLRLVSRAAGRSARSRWSTSPCRPTCSSRSIREVVQQADHMRGMLAQKPLGVSYPQAVEIVAAVPKRPASRWPSIRTCATTSRSAPARPAARSRRARRAGAGDDRHAGDSALDAVAAAAGLGHAADHEHPSSRHVPLLVRRSPARVRQRAPDPRTARSLPTRTASACTSWNTPTACGPRRGTTCGPARPRRSRRRHRHPLARRRDRRAAPRHDRLARVSASDAQHARLHDACGAGRSGSAALERGLVSRRLRRPDGRAALGARGAGAKPVQRPATT